MALSATQRAEAFVLAQARIRARQPDADLRVVGRDVSAALGITSVQDRASIGQVVRSANLAFEQGSSISANDPAALRPDAHGRDQTLQPGDARYRYRAVVRVGGPGYADAVETLVIVDSDRPLTYGEINSQAVPQAQQQFQDRDYPGRISQVSNPQLISVYVVSAGRQ